MYVIILFKNSNLTFIILCLPIMERIPVYSIMDDKKSRGVVAEWLRCSLPNPGIAGSSPAWGHNHDSLYDTSTSWFYEVDSRVIYLKAKINTCMFKLKKSFLKVYTRFYKKKIDFFFYKK